MIVTFAQNLEDVLLARVFRDQPTGFYVDIGANHPVKLSITKHFYDQGWQGINVEPGQIFKQLAAARPRDINLNLAVSNSNGQRTFYEYPVGHALSSFNPDLPPVEEHWLEGRVERQVETLTLSELFAAHNPPTIDFMNVDVEGHQQEVLEGNDWTKWRPRVILAEATDPSQKKVFNQTDWESILLKANYSKVHFDGLNCFYLREEDQHLAERFQAPANVLDCYVPAHVLELRRDLRRKTETCDGQAAQLEEARQLMTSINNRFSLLQTKLQQGLHQESVLREQLVISQREIKIGKHEHAKVQQQLAAVQRQLADRVAELEHLRRRSDPKSLAFGLKVARLVHKIKVLPKRLLMRKAA